MLLVLMLTAAACAAPPGSLPPEGSRDAAAADVAPVVPELALEQLRMPGGLDVVLARTRSPLATISLFYHVGTAQDPPHRSGLAHLVEHVVFTGASGAADDRARRRLLAAAGLVRARGYTGLDWTAFEYVLPADNAAVGIWLLGEQVRTVPGVSSARLPEVARGVVEEHVETSDDKPGGRVWEQLLGALYPAGHPYHSLLGSVADVSAASADDVGALIRTWYTPSNAMLVVVGAIDLGACRREVERRLSALPDRPRATHAPYRMPEGRGEQVIRLVDRDDAPRLHLAWPAPARLSQGEPRIELLGLVAKARLRSLHASVEYEAGESGGVLRISADAGPGGLAQLLATLDAELGRLGAEPPTPGELATAVRRRETRWLAGLDGVDGLSAWASMLRDWRFELGDADRMAWDLGRYRAVTVAELADAARTALARDRRVVAMPPDAGAAAGGAR